MPRAAPAALGTGLLLGLILVALWPLPLALFSGELIGHPTGDLADHVQGGWWFGGELIDGRWPDTTSTTHFPEQLRLHYVDPVGAFLGLLLRPLGVTTAWNLLVLLQLMATTACAAAMAADLSRSRSAALIAAAAAGPSAYALGLVHSGLTEYLGLAPVIVASWAIIRALERDPSSRPAPRGAAVIAGAAIALSALQAPYYGVFTALLALVATPGRGWRSRIRPLIFMGLVAILLSIPQLIGVVSSLSDPLGAVRPETAPGWDPRRLPETDLLTFVLPGNHYHPDTPARGNPGILHVNYLGWITILLAGLGLARQSAPDQLSGRSLGLPLALIGVLALGPVLCVASRTVELSGQAVILPLALLYLPGSPLDLIHHPYRLVAAVLPLLGTLAACGARRLPSWSHPVLAVLIVLETVLISPAPWPLATTSPGPPDIHENLPAGAVLDWPPDASTWNRSYALWQIHHAQPIPYGVNVFLPAPLRSDPLIHDLIGLLDDPRKRAHNRDVPFQGRLLHPRQPDSSLSTWGFSTLVLHRPALDGREWQRTADLLNDTFGPPDLETPSGARWSLDHQ